MIDHNVIVVLIEPENPDVWSSDVINCILKDKDITGVTVWRDDHDEFIPMHRIKRIIDKGRT